MDFRTTMAHTRKKQKPQALREAVRLYKVGNRDAAIAAMKRVIAEFPNTTVAATAQANLTKISAELR